MPTLDDDSKVMDVSKPSQAKPVATSRPVIAPIVSEPAKDETVSVKTESTKPPKAAEPSEGKKVIAPVSDDMQPGAESVASDPKDSSAEPSGGEQEGDDSAAVDELVSKAETKREAAKKAEEQAKKDAELQALIDSKQYVVPISGSGGKSGRSKLVMLALVMVVLLCGGYLLADAGAFGKDIKLPFEIIKDKSEASDSVADMPANVASKEDSEDKEVGDSKPASQEDEEKNTSPSITPEVRSRDTDRKNELKNLQQRLETYFNDNARYPARLSDLDLSLDVDELTDDLGQPYQYQSDGNTYTLRAQLENPDDPDGEDGVYILLSVNQ